MYEDFTDRARLVMELSAEVSAARGHTQIESDDVLFAMIREGEGVAGHILKNLDVDHSRFDTDISPRQSDRERELLFDFHHDTSSAVRQLVDNARQETNWLNHKYVGTEHLLIGLCRVPNSAAFDALVQLGIQPGDVCKETINLLGAGSEEWKRNHPDIDFSSGTELWVFDR